MRAAPDPVVPASPVATLPSALSSFSRPWLLVCGLWLLVLHGSLFWIDGTLSGGRRLWGDELTYQAAAERLLAGAAANLDALWPPLYPYFLAALERIGGLLAVQVAQSALLGMAAWFLFDLGRRVLRPTGASGDAHAERTAMLAAGIAAALLLGDPQVAAFAHYLWPEILHLALMLFALWALVARAGEARWLAAAGVALGLALLTKSILGPFLPVLLAPLALAGGWRVGLRRVAVVVALIAATVAPVMLANWRSGEGLRIADSSRFNLWVGLNDRSRRNLVEEIVGEEYARYRASADDTAGRNAVLVEKIRGLVRARPLGDLVGRQLTRQPFRLFDRESFLTDQLAGGAIAAAGYGYPTAPPALAIGLRVSSYAVYGAVLVLAAVGVWALRLRGRAWLWVLIAFVAYNLVLFLGLHVKTRYRIQFLPVLYLYAGYAVAAWHTGTLRLRAREWIAAAGTASLVLFLALAGPWLDRRTAAIEKPGAGTSGQR